MKLVDLDTKITALLWDDEHEEETEREMTIGDFLDEFTVEGLLEIPLYIQKDGELYVGSTVQEANDEEIQH